MTQEQWEKMTPEEQADFWWAELSAMLRDAAARVRYVPGNAQTTVLNGNTTIVTKRKESA